MKIQNFYKVELFLMSIGFELNLRFWLDFSAEVLSSVGVCLAGVKELCF
jgi:hypothetical protein